MKHCLHILIIIGLIGISVQLEAQVRTDYNNRVSITARGMFNRNFSDQRDFTLEARDIKALLAKEAALNRPGISRPFAIADPVKVDIDVARNATWQEDAAYAYGKYTIHARGAKSISANFDRFYLPPGSELYVYSANGEMLTGPVTDNENNNAKIWGTWVYKGELMTIDLKVPLASKRALQLHVSNIAYGYKDVYRSEVGDFGESAGCNINVLCSLGSGWDNERNSVALILNGSGSALCSGALINNACNMNTPYLLTANHCFVANSDVANWRFTFQAWSPTCDPNQNSAGGALMFGSTLRARSATTDFCLVELGAPPTGTTGISYSGWSRNTSGVTSTTIIHHPAGDVMKITRDDQAPTTATFLSAQTWRLVVDQGATQGGSSGAPYYDQNHRIIGQHFGTDGINSDVCQNVNKFGGRFDLSWDGDGTSTSRLRDWLDPGNSNAMTVNSRGTPVVVSSAGSSPICNSATFSLLNQPPGSSVTWGSSNSSVLSINASTGSATRTGHGLVTVTATVAAGCGNFLVRLFNVSVGSPAPTSITADATSCPEIYFEASLVPTATQYNWQYYKLPSGSITSFTTSSTSSGRRVLSGGSTYRIGISTSGACGTGPVFALNYTVPCGGGGHRIVVSPNPTSEILTIELADAAAMKSAGTNLGHRIDWVALKNDAGTTFAESNGSAENIRLPVNHVPKGIYFLHASVDGQVTVQRVVIGN